MIVPPRGPGVVPFLMSDPEIIDGYTTPGTERDTRLGGAELLAQMDAAGVARAVIAPQDREIAAQNAAGNARILALAAAAGGRLIPACTVNPWHGEAGIALLREAVADGARMLVLSGALQGFLPCDDVAAPLLLAAGELGVPAYFHTGPHATGAPAQVVLAARKHPGTRFVLGHCGVTDHSRDMPAIYRHQALPNLWFELSYVRPWGLPATLQAAPHARFIWGSAAPRNPLGFELSQFRRYVPPDAHPDIYAGHLRALLGLEARR